MRFSRKGWKMLERIGDGRDSRNGLREDVWMATPAVAWAVEGGHSP